MEVLHQLDARGEQRFSELQRRLDVASTVLSDALTDLTDVNAVVRDERSESPPHVEYALTDAGEELLDIVNELGRWDRRHRWETPPSVIILDEHDLCGDLYADWLARDYDVTLVTDYRQLEKSALDEANVVVFHYRGRDLGIRTSHQIDDAENRCVVVTPMQHDRDELQLRPATHLVEPVLKEPLRRSVRSVLEERSLEDS